jgi:hypothetical protein
MKISRDELLEKYNTLIDSILDECDWKSSFTGEEVCGLVHHILKRDDKEPNLSSEELYKLYSKKVDDLKISREEWVDKYGVPEIITMIYEILQDDEKKLEFPLL